MKYQVKQKIFSLGDSFTIKNEQGDGVYLVKSKVISLGKKLTIEDLSGEELVYIEQKLFKLLPQFTVFMAGRAVATVKKEFTFFASRFNIDSDMGQYKIEGEVFSHEFAILKDNSIVGQVSKQWVSFSDTYGVDVNDDENQAFILALIIIVDEAMSVVKNRGMVQQQAGG